MRTEGWAWSRRWSEALVGRWCRSDGPPALSGSGPRGMSSSRVCLKHPNSAQAVWDGLKQRARLDTIEWTNALVRGPVSLGSSDVVKVLHSGAAGVCSEAKSPRSTRWRSRDPVLRHPTIAAGISAPGEAGDDNPHPAHSEVVERSVQGASVISALVRFCMTARSGTG